MSPELSFNSEHDNSGRYRSYKDSSGDQGDTFSSSKTFVLKLHLFPGDVDSGDDYHNDPHPQYLHYQYPHQSHHSHPHPPYPGPRARDRVVIGGYTHQTPL